MPHNHVKLSETGFQGCTHEDHDHLKIHRLNENRPTDTSHYLMACLCEVNVGKPIHSYHPGPHVAYVTEGELHVEDQSKPGEISKLAAGDLVHIDQGTSIIWTSPSTCKVFAVAYIPTDHHPEDLVVNKSV